MSINTLTIEMEVREETAPWYMDCKWQFDPDGEPSTHLRTALQRCVDQMEYRKVCPRERFTGTVAFTLHLDPCGEGAGYVITPRLPDTTEENVLWAVKQWIKRADESAGSMQE